MIEIERPKIEIAEISDDNRYGKFICEPLERGYGTTLGVSLRRILLSSLSGAAITSIKVEGLSSKATTISGVKDDIENIILNLKEICFNITDNEAHNLRIDVTGEKTVTAADIEKTSEVEILNPELYITNVETGKELHLSMTVESGCGYASAEKNKKRINDEGLIPIDSIFSPVLRVNYTVQDTRVGNVTDYDKLILEIWTNGSIQPEEAVSTAAGMLTDHLICFCHMAGLSDDEKEQEGFFQEEVPGAATKALELPIEDLDLSFRSFNALKRAGINTIGDLTAKSEEEMLKVRNLGRKSLDEVKNKLQEYDLTLLQNEE